MVNKHIENVLHQQLGKCKLKPQWEIQMLTKMAKIKKMDSNKCGEDVEELLLSYTDNW